MDEIETGKNYFRNIKTSRDRTVRIEVVGEIEEGERHFLDGIGVCKKHCVNGSITSLA